MTNQISANHDFRSEFISPAEFAVLMAPYGLDKPPPRIAVGVSGGADSMALATLSHKWATDLGGNITALIVDHGLRPESAEEAKGAAGWLADRGVQSEILNWHGPKPASGIQAAARTARYREMTRWCATHGVTDLLLAHHRDDQAETFMLRLGHASGIDGLACMSAVAPAPISGASSVRLVRPLLPVAKSRLIATLKQQGVPWVEDPSNQNTSFTRVRLRRILEGLAEEGYTSARLSLTARRMARAGHALRVATQELLDRSVVRAPAGYCEIAVEDFCRAPEEISLRALSQMLKWAGGPSLALRLERTERLHNELMSVQDFSGRTLGGCRIEILKRKTDHYILVCREARAASHILPLPPGSQDQWDGRFQVALEDGPDVRAGAVSFQVRRLGSSGWRQIAPDVAELVRRTLPAPARPSLPALWDRDGVVSVPLANYLRPDSAPSLARFETEIRWVEAPGGGPQAAPGLALLP